jgi:hypothetical protein
VLIYGQLSEAVRAGYPCPGLRVLFYFYLILAYVAFQFHREGIIAIIIFDEK